MSDQPTSVNEYDAIAATMQYYIDGAKSGRSEDMKPAFHDEATIFGYVGPELFAGPIQGRGNCGHSAIGDRQLDRAPVH
jgi:hypothetical protein